MQANSREEALEALAASRWRVAAALTVAMLVAYLGWGILSYILKVIELSAAIPYASVNIAGMQMWMMAVYYALLVAFLYSFRVRLNDSSSGGM